MTTTGNIGLDAMADAIAERVWAKLEDRLADTQAHQLLSVPEAAGRLGIGRTKLHGMIASGEFPTKAVRHIGRRVLIHAAEMDRWLSAR